MSYSFIILLGLIAGAIARTATEKKQFENFYRFAKKGDPCKYLLNGKKHKGTVDKYYPDYIYSYVKDKNGFIHRVSTSDISPLLTYNYKSWR